MKNKKFAMIALGLIMAVGAIGTAYALPGTITNFDELCEFKIDNTKNQMADFLCPIVYDHESRITALEERLLVVEDIHFPLTITPQPEINYREPIGEPFTIDGFTATEHNIDRTNDIVMSIYWNGDNGNGTEIYNGPQPVTFTPDQLGAWCFVGTVDTESGISCQIVTVDPRPCISGTHYDEKYNSCVMD